LLVEVLATEAVLQSLSGSVRQSVRLGVTGARIRGMTTRERAEKLLGAVPDSELEPIIEILASRAEDPMIAAFRDAPEDDEPWTDEDEAAMAEVRADEAAGVPTIPLEEIKAKYGLA